MHPYKLGKQPVKHDPRTFKLEKYLDLAKLPTLPHSYQFSKDITSWGMMGNDQIGNCTIAAAGHGEMSWTDDNKSLYVPPDADILNGYIAVTAQENNGQGYNPLTGANDNGCACLDVLNYWRNTGISGHKINSFVQINNKINRHVEAAIYLFGFAYIGLSLPLTAQNQSTLWSRVGRTLTGHSAPGSWGGHCVIVTGWDATGLDVITWGQQIRMTWWFWETYVDEAYAIISNDFFKNNVSPDGFNMVALQADLKLL